MLIAGVWILGLFLLLQFDVQSFRFPDSATYIEASRNLYRHGIIDAYRPLLMSVVYGLPLLFTDSDVSIHWFSVLINIMCWLGTVFLLNRLLQGLLLPRKAFMLSLCYVFSVGSSAINFHLLSEPLFVMVSMSWIYLLFLYSKRGAYRHLCLALVLILLSALIRPGAIVLGLTSVIAAGVILYRNFFSRWTLLVGISVSCLLLVMGYMKERYGNFSLSYIDAYTYYNYLGSRAESFRLDIPYTQMDNERYRKFDALSLPQGKEEAARDFREQLQHNRMNLIGAYGYNMYNNASMGSATVFETSDVKGFYLFESFRWLCRAVSKIQNIVYSVAGLILSVMVVIRFKKRKWFYVVPAVFVLYNIAVSAISSDQGDRFHLVFYPMVLILAAYIWHSKQEESHHTM